jgi:hypothetical protein
LRVVNGESPCNRCSDNVFDISYLVGHVKSAATRQDPSATTVLEEHMIASMMKSQEDGAQTNVRGRVRDLARSAPQMVLGLHQSDKRQCPSDCPKKTKICNRTRRMHWNRRPALERWSTIHQNFTPPPYIMLHTPTSPSRLATFEVVNRILTQRFVNCFYCCILFLLRSTRSA